MKQSFLLLLGFMIFSITTHAQKQGGACLNCKNGKDKITPLDGNTTMGLTFQKDTCGLNYVKASVNTQTRYTATPGTGFPTTCPSRAYRAAP